MYLRELASGGVNWIDLAQDSSSSKIVVIDSRQVRGHFVNGNKSSDSVKFWEILKFWKIPEWMHN
jgi:hypothetical protein